MWYVLIAANIVQAALFIYKWSSLPPQIPLFYSKNQGEEQIVDLWMIAVLPILMNGLTLVNQFIYRRFFPNDVFAKYTVKYANITLIVSLTLIFVKILFLVS